MHTGCYLIDGEYFCRIDRNNTFSRIQIINIKLCDKIFWWLMELPQWLKAVFFAQNFGNLMLKYNFMRMRFKPHEVRSNTEELGKIR